MSFADILASGFGGGPQYDAAYLKGADTGSQIKLRSAQTDSALANARESRSKATQTDAENAARENLKANAKAMGLDDSLVGVLLGGYNPQQLMDATATKQKVGFNTTIGDPTADRGAQLAAMEAVKGGPVERFYDVGSGMQANQLHPEADPVVNPVGQASIDANHALADNRESGGAPVVVGGVLRDRKTGQPIGDINQYWDSIRAGAEARGTGSGLAKLDLARPQAEAYVQTSRSGFDQAKGQITQLAGDPSLWQGVSLTQKIGSIPGTAGAAVRGRIAALQSNLTQQALQNMRRASTTGGAVGQVTEREWKFLADSFGALDPNMSVQDFLEGLHSITQRLDQGMADTENAFVLQYGRQASANARWGVDGYQAPGAIPPAPGTAPAAVPTAAPAAGAPQEGTRQTSKSGKPMVYHNGHWEYE